MTETRFIALALIGLLILPGCGSRSGETLVLTGSSTVAPVMADLAAAFERGHPGWRIDVQSGGSHRGIRDARLGLADAGMVSRELFAGESDLTAYPLAHDGIALIVHADNPVPPLSAGQIVAIYRGEVDNWAEVGGRDRPVTVVNKAAGRATLEVFLAYFELAPEAIEADLVAGENQQVLQTVAGNPDAIGYVSIGAAEVEAGNGLPIRLLPLNGVPATADAVSEGRYPLSRPLNVVTRGPPSAALRSFMQFWRTPAGAALIRDHYFVPAGR